MTNMPMRAVSDAFHEAWRLRWPFLFSHLVFSLLVVAILAPLSTLTLRSAIALSGQPALADFDIAMFLLSPVGFVALILVASLFLTSYVLDTAFMMAIALHARRSGERRFEQGIARILPRYRQILGFAWRLLLRVIGILVPFVLFALALAQHYLSEFDINYYLSEHPPEFVRAIVFIGIGLAVTLAILLRALLGWAVALPLVLFADLHPRDSFAASAEAMKGRRWDLFLAVLGWAAISMAVLTVLFGVVGFVSNFAAERFGADLEALAAALLALLAVWSVVNLVVTATTTGALAVLLMERAGWPGTKGADMATPRERRALRKGLLAALAVGAMMFLVGGADLVSIKVDDEVQIIAHRGSAGARPENTMAAFEKAIADKADWIELDVQESAEGEVIVVHDSDFMKLAGNPLKVWDSTAEELAEIDVGSWFAPEYSAERTPLLRDVLELAKGTQSGVLIELKYYGHDEMLEQRVADVVEETGMVDHVRLMSLKFDAVKKMKALRPDWTVGLLATATLGKLWELEADFIAINMGTADAALVAHSRDAGKDLYVWTVNDPMSMSRALSLGVTGLITDEPALAREVIEQRAELGSLERMVLALGSQLGLSGSEKVYRDVSP